MQQPLQGRVPDHPCQPGLRPEIHLRRGATEVPVVHGIRPDRSRQLLPGGSQQPDPVSGLREARPQPLGHVVDHAEHADGRGGQDRGAAGLVVEGDVPSRDRDAEFLARIDQAEDGLDETPHHLGVLGGAEVEAVGDGHRFRGCHRDIPVRLGQ